MLNKEKSKAKNVFLKSFVSKKDNQKYSYKSSGVDLNKAYKTLNLIKKSVMSTFSDKVLNDLSSFSGLFELDISSYKNPILTSSTDGVGTKILVAKEVNCYKFIGQDVVAMVINDILCCGAKPLFFLDYIACGKLDPEKIKIIVDSIAYSCRQCSTVLIGGETAEMPDMYGKDDIDVAGFAVGIVDRSNVMDKGSVKEDDIIVGISSSGIHSNGFSLVRKIIIDKNLDLNAKYDWSKDKTLAGVLLTPTKLYFGIMDEIINRSGIKVHGVAHITGGGFYENINRIIPNNLDAVIVEGSWEVPVIFKVLQDIGSIDRKEMYRVFNMGIGMVIIIPPCDFNEMKRVAEKHCEDIYKIGKVTSGGGKVKIIK